MIENIKNSPLNLQSTSVYNFNEFTLTELLNRFFSKINECVDISNQALNFLTWLKGEGLTQEAIKELNNMYNDGRLSDIIDNMSGNLNIKLENNKQELNNELIKVNTQLDLIGQQKLDKNGIVTMSNLGQDVKTALTGGSVAIVGKDMVLTENILPRQVTPIKTNFMTPQNINLLKINESTFNGYSDTTPTVRYYSDETIITTTGMCAIFYNVTLEVGKTYTIEVTTNCENVRFFQRDKTTLVLNIPTTETNKYKITFVATVSNVCVRFWCNTESTYSIKNAVIVEGNDANENWTLDESYVPNIPKEKIKEINNSACSFIKPSVNLIDKRTAQKGYMVNNGSVTDNEEHTVFSLIDNIEPNTYYYCNKLININFFNDSTYLSSMNGVIGKIQTPTNTTKVRVSMKSILDDDINSIQFEKGEIGTEYQEFGKGEFDESFLPKSLKLTNTFKGKKLCSFGDSITAGATWQTYVVNKFGFTSHVNCGVGGTKVVDDGTNTGLCTDTRVNTIPTDSDVILIMGGTNDCGQNVQIGDLTYPYDTTKFKGALATTIKKIQERCPNATIVVMSLLSGRGTVDTNGKAINMTAPVINTIGLTSEDYAKATQEVAHFMSVEFIDVFGKTGINQFNRATYISDTVHPNVEGGKKIARVVINGLKNVETLN